MFHTTHNKQVTTSGLLRPALFCWLAGVMAPLLMLAFTLIPSWSKHEAIRLLIASSAVSLFSTLLYGCYLARKQIFKRFALPSVGIGAVGVALCYDIAMAVLSASNLSTSSLAAIGAFASVIPAALALALFLSVGGAIGALLPAEKVTDPEGRNWTVGIQLIPHRKGIGVRERFIGRWSKKRRQTVETKDQNKAVSWGDFFFNIPDSIDGLELLLAMIALAILFMFVGWPILLLLADLMWLVLVALGAFISYVILRRPITVLAKSGNETHSWKARSLKRANSLKREIASSLSAGILPSLDQTHVRNGRFIRVDRRKQHKKLRTGLVVFAGLVGLVSYLGYRDAMPKPAVHHAKKVVQLIPGDADYYAAPKYKFKINFPGPVEVSNETATFDPSTGNVSFPYNVYSSSMYHNTQVYEVQAYDWPVQNTDFASMDQSTLKSSLTTFVNSDIENVDGKLVDIKDTREYILSGQTLAEQAAFTFTNNGYPMTGYARSFTVGNYEYDIIGEQINEATFDSFADSFEFTGTTADTLSNNFNDQGPDQDTNLTINPGPLYDDTTDK